MRVVVGIAVVGELEDLELIILITGDIALLLEALNLAGRNLEAVVGDAWCLLLQEPSLSLLEFLSFNHLVDLSV